MNELHDSKSGLERSLVIATVLAGLKLLQGTTMTARVTLPQFAHQGVSPATDHQIDRIVQAIRCGHLNLSAVTREPRKDLVESLEEVIRI